MARKATTNAAPETTVQTEQVQTRFGPAIRVKVTEYDMEIPVEAVMDNLRPMIEKHLAVSLSGQAAVNRITALPPTSAELEETTQKTTASVTSAS